MKNIAPLWDDVRSTLDDAIGITWDGCHKIYLIMDLRQHAEFLSYGYDTVGVDDPDDALATLKQWYDESCFLRFVTAVSTVDDDPNAGYYDLIPQGAEEEP